MVKNLEIIEQAIEFLKNGLWKNNPDTIKSMLFEFARQNTPKMSKLRNNLSVWDCVGNDKLRPVLSYVYLDKANKVAVGTDGHIIFVNPDEYRPVKGNRDGMIVNRDYTEHKCGCKYPEYQKGIPSDENLVDIQFIDEEEIKNMASIAVADARITGNKLPCIQTIDGNPDSLISTRFIPYILSAGTDGWKRCKSNPIYVKKFEGKTISIFGILRNQ